MSVVFSAIVGIVLLGVPLAFVGWYAVAIGSMAFAACIPRTGNCNYALGAGTIRAYPFLAGLLLLASSISIWLIRDRANPRGIAILVLGALVMLGALILLASALMTYAATA